MSKFCKKCGEPNDGITKFCKKCGAPTTASPASPVVQTGNFTGSTTPTYTVTHLCNKCGHQNDGISKFCIKCGFGLAQAATALPVRQVNNVQNTHMPPPYNTISGQMYPQVQKRKLPKIPLLIAACSVLVLVVVLIIVLTGGNGGLGIAERRLDPVVEEAAIRQMFEEYLSAMISMQDLSRFYVPGGPASIDPLHIADNILREAIQIARGLPLIGGMVASAIEGAELVFGHLLIPDFDVQTPSFTHNTTRATVVVNESLELNVLGLIRQRFDLGQLRFTLHRSEIGVWQIYSYD